MAQLTKRYAIPLAVDDDLRACTDGNRSLAVRTAIAAASDKTLLDQISFNLAHPRSASRSVSVTIATDQLTTDKLNDLAKRSDLPIEQVLKFLLQGYVRQINTDAPRTTL